MASLQNECLLPESIRCYLLRGNVMVPLVPADQLPFQIKGIPRQLSHRQMSDEGWKLFRETKEPPFFFSIQAPPANDSPSHYSPGRPQYLAPDHRVRTESQIAHMTINRAGQPSLATVDAAPESPDMPFTGAVERLSPLTDAVASIYPSDALRLGYTSSTVPGIPKKVYCTHWIATGECRWTLTGCKYKHEMPGTEKLRELGFTRGTPKWWKDKNAVSPPKSMTWMQRRLGRVDGEEPQNADMLLPRAFPDPSTLRARRLEECSDDAGNEAHKRTVVPREDQPMAPKPSLPVSPSARAPPVHSSPQTPNLIDLEDTSILSGSSPCSLISSSGASESSSPFVLRSDTPHPGLLSSSPLPPSSPSLPTPKTKLSKKVRTRRHRAPRTCSSSPPSSSTTTSSSPPSSSSSSSSPEESSDTDVPRIRTRIPARKINGARRIPYRSKLISSGTTTATTTAASAAAFPRLVKSGKNVQPAQLGLASSKYAVQTATTISKTREDKDGQAERSARKVHHRRERRGEGSG